MKIIDFDIGMMVYVGDIHMEFKALKCTVKMHDLHDCALIVAGDCGFGFCKRGYYDKVCKDLNPFFRKRNVYVIMIRGNHDNPAYFDGTVVNCSHFMAVPDYTVLRTQNHNVLLVGGAISIDRNYRTRYDWDLYAGNLPEDTFIPRYYWPKEYPIYDKGELDDLKSSGIKIDVVCTHTCPDFCEPLKKDGIRDWMTRDENLEDDIDYERQTMTKLYERLIADSHPIQKWVYGHYHYHHMDYINNVCFIMLDMQRDGICDIVDIR
jgi:hypothetical protein